MMLKNEKTKKMNYKNADNIAENKIFKKKRAREDSNPRHSG